MRFKVEIIPHTLYFKCPARTSRGTYFDRKVWYVRMSWAKEPDKIGIGECAPLPGLSCDYSPDYERILARCCRKLGRDDFDECEWMDLYFKYPSIAFGLTTVLEQFETKGSLVFGKGTPFSEGKQGIPINGLIWMGDHSYMFEQIKQKIEDGFRCIKLKIGAIDFEEELDLLRYVRQHFSSEEIELRVDANGAFAPSDALEKLKRLSDFEIHSIEQPIPAGHWDEMADLVRQTPVPIALDEELIGCKTEGEQERLLDHIHPHYIVIKPSLHGSILSWAGPACNRGIGWWVTSALESNIGLNAIAHELARHMNYQLGNELYQGLGTGMLFKENVEMPLSIKKGELWFNPNEEQHIRVRDRILL